jgi:hypothetical protein
MLFTITCSIGMVSVDKKNVSKLKLQYLKNYALYLFEISHTITNMMLTSFHVNYMIVALL